MMKVEALQSFVSSLTQPLRSSGGARIAEDLEQAIAALEPFKDWKIVDFASFLVQAEEYKRTGILPATGRRRGASQPRATKVTIDVPTAVRTVGELYERATDDVLTYSDIDEELKKLDKGLKKDQILQVAHEFGIAGKLTKAEALKEIERKIKERKGTFQRIQTIGASTAGNESSQTRVEASKHAPAASDG
jgi:hypothetical protein